MRMHLHVEEEHWVSKYVSSFYFIYATLTTVGYGDIAGLSTNERIFCIGIMVLGGFLFGVLIGSLPTILDRRSEAGGRYARLEKSLTEYLVDKKVPPALKGRIFQFFEYRYPERRSFNGHRIIQDLPRSLRKELALHVHKTVVTACPLLTRCSPDTLGEICMLLRKVFCAEGDTIVSEGTPSTGIYFIKTGQVTISRDWETVQVLRAGGVFGENCLFDGPGDARRCHTATAAEPVELCVLPRADFEELVATRSDFIATYNIDGWRDIRERLLRRRDQYLGVDKKQAVLEMLSEARGSLQSISKEQGVMIRDMERKDRGHSRLREDADFSSSGR